MKAKLRTAILCVTLNSSLLASCTSNDQSTQQVPDSYGTLRNNKSAAIALAPQALNTPPNKNSSNNIPKNQIFQGTGVFWNKINQSKPVKETTDKQNGITLNFVNADLRDVVRAVLEDALGLRYALDPDVNGTVTFQSTKAIPREDVLPAFEKILSLYNVALVYNEGFYQVLPAQKADKFGAQFQLGRNTKDDKPGYRYQIVPLQFISVSEMTNILSNFGSGDAIVSSDQQRNFLVLAGTGSEINILLETIDLFDANQMDGMSFGIFRADEVDAVDLTTELLEIFDRMGSSLADLVELIPLPRINGLLVISPQKEYIADVQQWVHRLDVHEVGPGRRLYHYPLQNAKAEDIAQSLSLIVNQNNGIAQAPLTQPTEGFDQNGGFNANATPSRMTQAGNIVADTKANALIIMATAAEYEIIEAAIQKMDIAPDQVFIESTIAEVKLNDQLRYGVQYFFDNAESTFNFGGLVTSSLPGFDYTYTVSDARIALNALESVTDINVISSPKIMTLNNETARLQVGDQVPVATQSAVSVVDTNAPIVNNVQFRDTGVILEVTPRINKSGMVILEVNQEVSDVAETTTSGIDSPTIQQRKIASTVAVQDGQTIALGGLIRDSETLSKSGVPIISRLPIVGAPFRSTSNSSRRTELLIFITPHIVRSTEDARVLTDYLRSRLQNSDFFDQVPELNNARDER